MIDENFTNHSVDYSFLATFVDFGSFVICLIVPEIAIGTDLINDIIKTTMSNIDLGKLWG